MINVEFTKKATEKPESRRMTDHKAIAESNNFIMLDRDTKVWVD